MVEFRELLELKMVRSKRSPGPLISLIFDLLSRRTSAFLD
jgi:hypothetical protein